MNKSNPVVVASSSAFGTVRFRLRLRDMIEVSDVMPYRAYRSAVAAALKGKSKTVLAGLTGHRFSRVEHDLVVSKKSIQIGCMKFSGEHANKLRTWATRKVTA